MDSANNLERQNATVGSVPDVAPSLGGIAANLGPSGPNGYNVAPVIPEVGPVDSVEMLSNPETQIGPQASRQQVVQQAQQAQSQIAALQQITTAPQPQAAATNNPAAAADEDLIEKEWVERIKKVVSATKDNPYEQARLIGELMRDYVRKRYGKEVGKAPDDI